FFLVDCLLIGALAGSGPLSLLRVFGCTLGFAASVLGLGLSLMWAREPAIRQTGVRRLAELGVRSDIAQQRAIRVEDTELYRRWYLEFRMKQEAERCNLFRQSMAVVVVRLGGAGLATWAGNRRAWQLAFATAFVPQFGRA